MSSRGIDTARRAPEERGALCELEISPGPPLVSILVPTLDEERELPRLLDHLAALDGRWELIVSDGGSRDATRRIAREHPSRPRVIEQRGGRAAQLNAAARAATGDVLLFLHADSRLPADAYGSLAAPGARPMSRAATSLCASTAAAVRARARRGLPSAAPPRLLLRRLVGVGAARDVRRARRLPRDPDHGRLRLRPAPGAQRCRDALPARPRDDVGAALADDRHRAYGAGMVRDPLAVRRGRAAAAGSRACTGWCADGGVLSPACASSSWRPGPSIQT